MFDQITAEQLAEKRDAGESYALLDTRTEESYEAWRIPGAESIPFGPTETLDDEGKKRLDELIDSRPVITICGKGITSTNLAAELDANGYEDVTVVKGGMRDWNDVYERVPIDVGDDLVVVQFQRRAKGCLSYLVGSREAGEAIVVDPTRHTDQYVVTAAELGLRITRVVDTHVHADHVSGGRELAERLGVPYHLGAHARDRGVAMEFDPVEDGNVLSVGDVELTALHTPGHTSELTSYRIGDEAILTADALFVDSIGRTELEFDEDDAATGAEMAYETLHGTLAEQHADLLVLPGHVTVENDGHYRNGSPGEPVAAALGEVRERLDVLDLDEKAFVEQMVESVPDKPANYETIIGINRGRERVDDPVALADLETGANNCAA
ncbi:MBL fold metallo-hydrolase [Halegenticoccus tardaugens]|uniref:MBL fold metallo-hydrolase n=1 Tax=Halegenticoccus tardaugens TaxID=2071624 RepID=UPI00100A9F0E|nr:rhodanese-like domain-containing protein [Halegenticoccus tardaugens]